MAQISDYRRLDTVAYYYSPTAEDARSGRELHAETKAALLKELKAGKVFSFRKEINQFYLLESENKHGQHNN
jgi:hypothetical protein